MKEYIKWQIKKLEEHDIRGRKHKRSERKKLLKD